MFRRVTKEFKKSPFEYLLLFVLLLLAFFIRVYRINDLLGFHFDQGRDALVIWDLIYKGKFFLIGPVTGIEGIFRGPFYYYLIAPFYLLGRGNPVWPSVFLSFTSVLSILLLYFLARGVFGKPAGFFAVILGSFSYQIFYASRWLSNPTPMLLLSVVFVWSLLKIFKGNSNCWPVAVFVASLSLFHFGSAGELYYFLAIFIVFIWRKTIPSKKIIFLSIAAFVLVVLPQAMFDFRHERILTKNFQKSFLTGESFSFPSKQFVKDKIIFYHDVFTHKVFVQRSSLQNAALVVSLFYFIYFLRRLLKHDLVKVLLIILFSPMFGLIFFRGNYGNIYDYYLTGYYLPFILLYAIFLGFIWKKGLISRIFILWFFLLFLLSNLPVVRNTLNDNGSDARSVVFLNQKKAIDWIYKNADGEKFNVDVYVPPVIFYSYNYLFRWMGNTKYDYEPEVENISLLYTLYETDPPHPERLNVWLRRQKDVGKVEESISFGGVTVERRKRI